MFFPKISMSTIAMIAAGVSLLALTSVNAAPSPHTLVVRDVWAPAITSPKKDDVWTIGSIVSVQWDTANPPQQVTNYNGRLLLGYMDGSGNENLDTEHPLAQDFDLREGKVDISVPNVPSKDSYIVVLIGDSGNTSPEFTIARLENASRGPEADRKAVTGALVACHYSRGYYFLTGIAGQETLAREATTMLHVREADLRLRLNLTTTLCTIQYIWSWQQLPPSLLQDDAAPSVCDTNA
ncbi:hypothetical protein EVG20_g5268 [Dentipellis fragilis]|uniref:Purple acid phosphatase N-terminal domain-containing protein n=1 Tax=Dentipellis fragilis TaxID=205917 RepID=A0A4Y9YW53_9AGAM|nr:hypothetical protein EVG20_g5268 [Dentipellis fragilis]